MKDQVVKVADGWPLLVVTVALWLAVPAILAAFWEGPGALVLVLLIPLNLFMTFGFFTLQPNEARVLVLFGQYAGTVRDEGFHWTNPFAKPLGNAFVMGAWKNRFQVSLRTRNFEIGKLKVNDQRGNPIEIGAVVVWRVADSAQALFDVDSYEDYVTVQSESALRHLASSYPYDQLEGQHEVSLRSGGETVHLALRQELQERLQKAGVTVDEARLTHLAYAPEIAGVMLRRQQAEAVIAARRKIVEGAVSMVEMALQELSAKKVVELTEERKAAMVGNLLVVLCGESAVQPMVNTGTPTT